MEHDHTMLFVTASAAFAAKRFSDACDMFSQAIQSLQKQEKQVCMTQVDAASHAYRAYAHELRRNIQIIQTVYQYESNPDQREIAATYLEQIRQTLLIFVENTVDILQKSQKFVVDYPELEVMLYTIIGDLYRYAVDSYRSDASKTEETFPQADSPHTKSVQISISQYSDTALTNYAKARQLAEQSLRPTSLARLSLALNMSIFLFQQKSCEEEALSLAHTTYQAAKGEPMEDCPVQVRQLLQQLQRNINLWERVLRVHEIVI